MPIYTIELDGKRYDIEGDRPPSEEEARQALEEFSPNGGDVTNSENKPVESVMNNGLDYVKQHPFKTVFQGAAQTITGKSAQDYALEATTPTENDIRPNDPLSYNMAFAKNAISGMAGSVVDMATSPANYVLGPLLGKAAVGVGKSGDKMIKFLQEMKGLEGAIKQKDEVIGVSQNAIKNLQNEFGAIRPEDLERKIENLIKTERNVSNNRLSSINDYIEQEAFQKLPIFRDALKNFFVNNSKKYGDRLDLISEQLIKNGESITKGEFSGFLDDYIKEAEEQFISNPELMNKVALLRQKYVPSFETGAPQGAAQSFKGMQKPRWNADDQLSLKEVYNSIKDLKNSLSSSVKNGYRYTSEDVAVAKLMSKWGDVVSKRFPELGKLNQDYKPVVQAMNVASKQFKPYADDFNIKGTTFLKNLAFGKNTGEIDTAKFMEFIENGTKEFPGVGNFSYKLKQSGNAMNMEKNRIDNTINDLMIRKDEAKDILSNHKNLIDAKNTLVENLNQKKKLIKTINKGAIATGSFVAEETIGPKYLRKLISGQ